ncbi:MAG: rRNA maturation RNase YbeY [Flavobacteriales bacterium]|jgi:rRNA maturation RNase YbeY|nr:rRNA maturation RNase YbeY [Flavobacteriales bacterium]
METNIYYHSECDFQLQNEDSISEWLKHAIRLEKKALGEINYIFCDDEYLLKKNQDFLNHDTLTDIITFDYSEENKLSADIFISIERVKENALIFAVPFEKELKRVIIHGILHLIGYKDKSEEETKTMRSKENFYLAITI